MLFEAVWLHDFSNSALKATDGSTPTDVTLRGSLVEAAHRLGRYDEHWSKLNSRLRRSGKPGSVAAAAVANRWVRWLFHQMKTIAV